MMLLDLLRYLVPACWAVPAAMFFPSFLRASFKRGRGQDSYRASIWFTSLVVGSLFAVRAFLFQLPQHAMQPGEAEVWTPLYLLAAIAGVLSFATFWLDDAAD